MARKHYIEFFNKTSDDYLSLKPHIFDTDDGGSSQFCVADVYGSIYFEGQDVDEKPIYYFRHSNPDSYRFAGFVEFGDSYLEPQKGCYHFDDIAQANDKVEGYRKLSDNPLTYGFGSEKPFSEFRFYNDSATFKETTVFDAKAIPLPITIVDHGCIFPPMNLISQPCLIKGTYEGKPIIGLGSYDRYYMPNEIKEKWDANLGYICALGVGLRPDGLYEAAMVTMNDNNMQVGYYWLEGQEPICDYKVEMEAKWVHLPYVDDGTCIYEKAVFKFGGIEFHIDGKWGTKGFLKEPRIEKHGQSHVFGTWYVGKEEYKHKLTVTFCENMNCFDKTLKEKGFEVAD